MSQTIYKRTTDLDPDDSLITNQTIAQMMKIDTKALSVIKRYNPDFPLPKQGRGCVNDPCLMSKKEVEAWLKDHPDKWYGRDPRPAQKVDRVTDRIAPFNAMAVNFLAGPEAVDKTTPFYAAGYDLGSRR